MTADPDDHIYYDEVVDFDFDALYRLLAAIDTADPRRDEAMQLLADAFDLRPPHLEKAIAARIAVGRAREAVQKDLAL